MSYKERLSRLERLLHVSTKLSKKYNLKGRVSYSSSSCASGNNSNASTPTSSSIAEEGRQQKQPPQTELGTNSNSITNATSPEGGGDGPEQSIVGEEAVEVEQQKPEEPEVVAEEEIEDDTDSINLNELKRLVFHGLPGDSQYRALVWRLLLNYLPCDSMSRWDDYLAKKRSNYKHFVQDLLLDNHHSPSLVSDHPLNPEPDSKWQGYFKDNDVLLQIDKDVRRLCPEISFFQSTTPYPNDLIISGKMDRLHKRVQNIALESSSVIRKGLGITKLISKEQSNNHNHNSNRKTSLMEEPALPEQEEFHWEVVERILFIYAKLNPGQSYVQGMNEIIGPIYYTLANDSVLDWRQHSEADTFYLFTNLMGEIRDFFIRSLDASVSGIGRMMGVMVGRLEGRDPAVAGVLSRQEIHPQYYAFRWITLLMSQEFPLPDVLRIWDSLLSDPKRFDFLIDLASAMIIHIRSELLTGDFPNNMKLLQNYPPIDVRDILRLASSFSNSSNESDTSSS